MPSESGNVRMLPSETAITPLVLDLNGNGIETSDVQHGVVFDLAGHGAAGLSAWISGGDGFLVRDINGDGLIANGREMFGEGTLLKIGTYAQNGFEALADMDDNGDQVIDARDQAFKNLQVWIDENHDGVTDLGELKGLTDLHIQSLNLLAVESDARDHGNLLGLVSNYTMDDGVQRGLVDVWFEQHVDGGPTVADVDQQKAYDQALHQAYQALLSGGPI